VGSLSTELGRDVTVAEALPAVRRHLAEILGGAAALGGVGESAGSQSAGNQLPSAAVAV
jgi:lipoyl(octanoyl) transferase